MQKLLRDDTEVIQASILLKLMWHCYFFMERHELSQKIGQTLLGSLSVGIALCGLSPSAKALTVNRGTDYLITPSGGAVFNFVDPSLGPNPFPVTFKGLPIGTPTDTPPNGGFLGQADTVVNRVSTVTPDADGEVTAIEIVGLSLQSVSPVNGFDVFAGLQKYYPIGLGGGTLSTGSMTIFDSGLPNGKKWNSTFNIFGVAIIAPTGTLTPTGTDFVKGLIEGCPGASYQCLLFDKGPFVATSEPWSETASLGQFEGENLVQPWLEQNFFLTGTVIHDAGDGTIHTVTPVPGPLPVLGIGAAFSFSRRLRKKLRIAVKAV
jgi:hypothetical protein